MTDYLVLRLRARHASLEEEIGIELGKPLPDAIRVQELKKEKLQVRDKLYRFLRADANEGMRA